MEKLNIAELLKDCPSGMELDCTMYDNVQFDTVQDGNVYPITINTPEGRISLSKYGCYSLNQQCKCIIFPKGKTTWEGFHRPFKDGDIITCTNSTCTFVAIYKHMCDKTSFYRYACLILNETTHFNPNNSWSDFANPRFATEEEKEKLFQAIKENGYKWNAETKTLEELTEPKFRVGDRVRLKSKPNYIYTIHSLSWDDKKKLAYRLLPNNDKHLRLVSLNEQDNYELVPNKFDLTTLKPFDKVLVRCSSLEKWDIEFFKKYNKDSNAKYPFICLCNNKYNQCVPFEGNEYLFDTTEECYDYYKNWK